eukprot:gene13387-13514_t
MRLLAFPLAAGLLDADLEDASNIDSYSHAAPQWQQQTVRGGNTTAQVQTPPARRSLFAAGLATRATGSDAAATPQQQQQSNRTNLLTQLAYSAVLITNMGEVKAACSSSKDLLYLPQQLGNILDLPASFPSYPWVLVHPGYANVCPKLVSTDKWCQLFQALGVRQFLQPQQLSYTLTKQQLLTDTLYSHWKQATEDQNNDARYVVQDWHMPELPRLLAGIQLEDDASKRRPQLQRLCRVLVGLWPTAKLSGWLDATYAITCTTSKGCELPADMAEKLNVHCDASLQTILHVLRSWSQAAACQQSDAARAGAEAGESAAEVESAGFVTTIAEMSSVYYAVQQQISYAKLDQQKGYEALDRRHANQQQHCQQGQQETGVNAGDVSRDVLLRLSACKSFSDDALIWLPDTVEVFAAASQVAKQPGAAAAEFVLADFGSLSGSQWPYKKPQAGSAGHKKWKKGGGNKSSSLESAAAVDEDVFYNWDVISSLQWMPMRGRFYPARQLRFTDYARVLEVLECVLLKAASKQAAAGAATASESYKRFGLDMKAKGGDAAEAAAMADESSLRVLSLYYPHLHSLFVEQLQRYTEYGKWIPLVGLAPTFGDYCRRIGALLATTDQPPVESSQGYKLVMRVLAKWSAGIASGKLPEPIDRLWNVLMSGPEEPRNYIGATATSTGSSRTSSQGWRLFPAKANLLSWVSLSDGPLVPDDAMLTQLFADVPGLTFLQLPEKLESFHHSSSSLQSLQPLFKVLGIKQLSKQVRREPPIIRPEQPKPARQLSICLAAALPQLQRQLMFRLTPGDYQLHIYAVDAVEAVYLLPVINSRTASSEGLVSRGTANLVERREKLLALLITEMTEHDGLGATVSIDSRAGDSHDGGGGNSTAAASTSASEDGGARHSSDNRDEGESKPAAAPAATAAALSAQPASTSPPTCDALYVVNADDLIRCSAQVAKEIAGLVAAVVAKAGLHAAVDSEELLKELLMVQASGGDVSLVMRQQQYSNYPQLPATSPAWTIHIPPEPQPEPAQEPGPQQLLNGEIIDLTDLTSATAASGASHAADRFASLADLTDADLFAASPASETSSRLHQLRLQEEAKIRAIREARAAERAAAGQQQCEQEPRDPLVIHCGAFPVVGVPGAAPARVAEGPSVSAEARAAAAAHQPPVVLLQLPDGQQMPAGVTRAAADTLGSAAAEQGIPNASPDVAGLLVKAVASPGVGQQPETAQPGLQQHQQSFTAAGISVPQELPGMPDAAAGGPPASSDVGDPSLKDMGDPSMKGTPALPTTPADLGVPVLDLLAPLNTMQQHQQNGQLLSAEAALHAALYGPSGPSSSITSSGSSVLDEISIPPATAAMGAEFHRKQHHIHGHSESSQPGRTAGTCHTRPALDTSRFVPQAEVEDAARKIHLISDRILVPQQLLASVCEGMAASLPAQMHDSDAAEHAAAAVGRLGEAVAYKFLQMQPHVQAAGSANSSGSRRLVVQWMNEHREQGLPYDLRLLECRHTKQLSPASRGAVDRGSTAEPDDFTVLAYIEVKSSTDPRRQGFQLSPNELDFATQQRARYHMLLVTGLNAEGGPSLQRLVDPVTLWEQRAISVCIVRH